MALVPAPALPLLKPICSANRAQGADGQGPKALSNPGMSGCSLLILLWPRVSLSPK